jgi:hypothetical protein
MVDDEGTGKSCCRGQDLTKEASVFGPLSPGFSVDESCRMQLSLSRSAGSMESRAWHEPARINIMGRNTIPVSTRPTLNRGILRYGTGQIQGRRWWLALFLVLLLPSLTGAWPAQIIELPLPGARQVGLPRYDLNSLQDLERLRADAQQLIRISERQETDRESRRQATVEQRSLDQMTLRELKAHFSEPEGSITKWERRGLKAIRREAAILLRSPGEPQRAESVAALRHLVAALHNGRQPPARRNLDTLQVPFVLAGHLSSPVARGRRPASNLAAGDSREVDLSLQDPLPGTFWRRPDSVASLDLYHGFGRTELPTIEGRLCEYVSPKTSYGGHPGYDVVCDGWRLKVKFGETTSEPFTARLFWALGYHVDPTDYVGALRVRYDRRLLREFHLRRDIPMTFRVFWVIPAHHINLQRRHDPFDSIAAAVLKNGSRITATELKHRLFHQPDQAHPEDDPANFRTEFEAQIDHLITMPANIQYRNPAVDSIGPWSFGQLGNKHRRELRGAGLLAAWLNWFDSRPDNTRLKTIEQDEAKELAHFFSDLGGTLGRGKGFFSGRGELPDEFDWTFTRTTGRSHSWTRSTGFQITGFKPIERTAAFREMTLDDARWMARLIAQLTEQQLVDSLLAAGFDSAHVRLYTEKLVSRRDQMIQDLGLADSIPLLRPRGVDRQLTYLPAVAGEVQSVRSSGEILTARPSDAIVAGGRIVRTKFPARVPPP